LAIEDSTVCSLPESRRLGPPREQPGRRHAGRHVGDLELHRLELGDRVTELLAAGRVRHGGFQGGLGDAQGERRDADAPAVQDAERVDEAVALAPEEVLRRTR
jgi:hypothetical protein